MWCVLHSCVVLVGVVTHTNLTNNRQSSICFTQDESEQGRIQGALYSLQALAGGVGPVLMRSVYHVAKDWTSLGTGIMFVFAGCLYMVAVAAACALPKKKANAQGRREEDDDDEDDGYSPLETSSVRSLRSSNSYGSIA